MGVSIIVVFEKEVTGADSYAKQAEGKIVAAALGVLDEIAEEKGLPALSSFIVDMEELLEGLDDGADAQLWFPSAEGVRAVSGLIAALQTEPKWAKRVGKKDFPGLIECLALLEQDLKIAAKEQARFSLDFT